MIPLFVALCASGLLFFSLVETAFGLLMRLPERLEAEREHDNSALSAYLDDPLKFFIPARLLRGTMLVLIVVLLAQPIGTGWSRGLYLFAAGFAIVLFVGQILPALIVRRAPERYLEILLPPFTVMANLLGPVTAMVRGWLGTADRAARREGNGQGNGQTPGSANGGDAPERDAESRLLRSVVDFGDTLVREVMTPRPDIVAIQATATIDDLRRLVSEQEYSRLPVYAENLDNIVGLVVVKDLIQLPGVPTGEEPVTTIMRPAAFVPETKRVADLLREFQQRRSQLAIAVDEHGGTAGLVTIEDVVEELVGEIRDEYDSEVEPIVQEDESTFTFSAKVAIDDFVERLGRPIEEGRFETVGGYVLSRVGRVPAVGERFRFDDFEVEILEAERRRIHKVRVHRLEPEAELEGGGAES
jgi:CBS domain containing-hemolysin-like protein